MVEAKEGLVEPHLWRRQNVVLPVVGVVITLLTVWTGPLQGWLIRLDSTPGPHAPYPASLWGGAGYNSSLPYALVFATLLRWFGQIISWLPLMLAMFLAFWGAGRLVKTDRFAQIGAGFVFALSPVMYERIWVGQFGYLVGYALLPWFYSSIVSALDRKGLVRMRPALLWAVMVGCSVHFLWIGAVVVFAVLVSKRLTIRALIFALGLVVTVSLLSAYLWQAGTSGESATAVGPSDLEVFATHPDPHLGLFGNVLALYGFWREGAILPKDEIGGWPFFLVAMLLVIVIGAVVSIRERNTRGAGVSFAVCAISGYLLTLGAQGPSASLYEWAYAHVPGFALMREPQKFIGILALAYSYYFAIGVTYISGRAPSVRGGSVTRIVAAVLPVLYVPTLFVGMWGELQPAKFPSSWSQADATMGDGPGKVLSLPWHQYMSFPFTENEIVGSPVDALFRRDVISGDNTELQGLTDTSPSRSRFIQFLLDNGSHLHNFGAQVRPLGVEYIALAKTVDWRRYSWLERQRDLQVVQDTPDLTLYRNMHAAPEGYRAPVINVADWGEAVGTVDAHPDVPVVLRSTALVPGDIRAITTQLDANHQNGIVTFKTPTSSQVTEGTGGVAIPAPYDDSWELKDVHPVQLASGTTGFTDNVPGGTATLGRWSSLRLVYAVSILTLVVIIAGPIPIGRFRQRSALTALRE